MSYTNETTHFGIPLPLGSDLTTPMDYNQAAADVDAALFEAQTNASQAASDASNAVNTANQAASDVGDVGADLNLVKGRVTALEQSDVIQGNKIDNLEIKVPTKFDSVGIADAYVNGLTYAIGDKVTYNGQRYVCNTAVAAAEPFDADKWTARDIQTDLDQIKEHHKITITNQTYKDVFDSLYSTLAGLTEDKNTSAELIVYDGTARRHFCMTRISAGQFLLNQCDGSSTNIQVFSVYIKNGDSSYKQSVVGADSATQNDYSSSTFTGYVDLIY